MYHVAFSRRPFGWGRPGNWIVVSVRPYRNRADWFWVALNAQIQPIVTRYHDRCDSSIGKLACRRTLRARHIGLQAGKIVADDIQFRALTIALQSFQEGGSHIIGIVSRVGFLETGTAAGLRNAALGQSIAEPEPQKQGPQGGKH